MAPVPRSRASEVLRRLSEGDDPDDDFEATPARPLLLQRMSSRGGIRTAAVIAVAALVGLGLVVARRPAPIEDRLPLVSVLPESDASTADDGATGAGAPSGDDPGTGGGTAAEARGSGSGDGPGDGESTAFDSGEVVVHVVGAVVAPGVVRLPTGSRAVDAVQAAGGLRADADPARVNLAALLVDGYRVLVPALGQEFVPDTVADPAPPASTAPGTGAGNAGSGPGAGGGELIDINTATAEQLDALPGVGPATAAAIVAHRERDGPFASVDALIEVRGIGEAKLDALRDLVTVTRS